MSASFHPSDDLLLAYGAGSLGEAAAVLIASHLALCPRCRADVAKSEAIGGLLLEDIGPVELSDGALAHALGRLETSPVGAPAAPRVDTALAIGQDGATALPRPLRDYLPGELDSLPWKWLGTGIEQVVLLKRAATKVRLLRFAPGTVVPEHGHGGTELTLVLQGGYSDADRHYQRGDVATADDATIHSPAADPDEPCLCLAVTEAPLKLTGLFGRLINPFLDL